MSCLAASTVDYVSRVMRNSKILSSLNGCRFRGLERTRIEAKIVFDEHKKVSTPFEIFWIWVVTDDQCLLH